MTQQKWWICKRIRNCMLGPCMLLLRVIPKCSISFSQSRVQFLEHKQNSERCWSLKHSLSSE
jgi:hypothetical protein